MADYRDWKVGDRVVCVSGKPNPDYDRPIPRLGGVYTISWVGLTDEGEVMIDLQEMPQPETEKFYRGVAAIHYRKVQPRKTSIAIFTAMLNRTDVRKEA
jgi:hypothetical protein